MYVKYRDVLPCVPPSFEQELIDEGLFLKRRLVIHQLYVLRSRQLTIKRLSGLRGMNCFLAEPYDTKPLVKEYSYGM
ncbi:MAG: hypothetical protein ACLTJ5_01445 [Clostridium sp.]